MYLGQKNNVQKIRPIDVFFGLITAICPIVGLTVYVSSMIFCFDSLHRVLLDAFPHSSEGSWICVLIRMYFTFVVFEVARTAAFWFQIFVLITDYFIHVINNAHRVLLGQFPKVETCRQQSVYLILIYVLGATVANAALSALYPGTFWVVVIACWLVVDGYELVSAYIYWMIFCIAPGVIVFLFGMLLFLGYVADTSSKVIKKLRNASKVQLVESKLFLDRRRTRIQMKQCISLFPLNTYQFHSRYLGFLQRTGCKTLLIDYLTLFCCFEGV